MVRNSLTLIIAVSSLLIADASAQTSPAGAEDSCPKNITVKANGVHRCAFNVVIHAADTTRQNDIFDLPTEVMVNIGAVIFGQVGLLGRDSYYKEGPRHVVRLKPDEKHKGYLMCAHRWHLWSEVGARNWDNRNRITPSEGYFEWQLRRRPGNQRSWYKADFVWVSRHPDYSPMAATCNGIADQVLREMIKAHPAPKARKSAPEPGPRGRPVT